MSRALRIGTRGSALALVQAAHAARALEARSVATEIVVVETAGDRRAPDTPWGEGAFVAAIEEALLARRVDIAVHSAKDIPIRGRPDLHVAAYLPRADARDALVVRADLGVRRLEELPEGCRVGTDSPRRGAFLRAIRADLVIVPVHGNVDTRLRRLDDGAAEALVLAVAGLERLGRIGRVSQPLPARICPPAPGQGAIALQVRAADEPALRGVSAADHVATRGAVELERELLRAMGGGCRSPVGALAEPVGEGFLLIAGAATPDGARSRIEEVEIRREAVSGAARTLAARLGRDIALTPARTPDALAARDDGSDGRTIPRGLGATMPPHPGPRVLVTRPTDTGDDLLAALHGHGLVPVSVPAIAVEPLPPGGALDAALIATSGVRRVVVSSPAGARIVLGAMRRLALDPGAWGWAAVGSRTARAIEEAGVARVWAPAEVSSAGLAAELPITTGEQVVVVRGDLARDRLAAVLRARGAAVRDVVAYHTREAPPGSAELLRGALADGPFAAVLFASASAVRGLLRLAASRADDIRAIPALCLGPSTAAQASGLGFRVVGTAPARDVRALAGLAAALPSRPGERPA